MRIESQQMLGLTSTVSTLAAMAMELTEGVELAQRSRAGEGATMGRLEVLQT